MKVGLLIATFSAIVIGVLIFLASRGNVDPPSAVSTAPGALDVIVPPALPNMLAPGSPSADATQYYLDAAAFYMANVHDLRGDNPEPLKAQKMTDMLVAAADAGVVTQGFLDDFVGMKRGEKYDEAEALAWVGSCVITHSNSFDDPAKKIEAAKAVWAYGVRLLEHSSVFETKSAGISNITSGYHALNDLLPQDDAFQPYMDYTDAVNQGLTRWTAKWSAITTLRNPRIGDLLRFAEYDQDPAFRIMALQQLGIVKFDPKSRANLEAIERVLAKMQNDPNPSVAKAAEIAAAFTKDDLKKVRG